ncbi:MAG: hypothetical protein ABEJ65_08450, partial [bacterium]
MKKWVSICIALTFAFTLVSCGSGGNQQQESNQQTKAFSTSIDIIIEEGTKKYDPMELTVTGDHGSITVNNKLDAEHG